MANLTETSTFETGIYQLETSDPVVGGAGGISNRQGQQLANRTKYLKERVDVLEAAAPNNATLAQVLDEIAKIGFKRARAATTANITLSGPQTIDGVSVNVGDRVLVKNQASATQNGVYVVASSAWSRATDCNIAAELPSGSLVVVSEGDTQADTIFKLVTNEPITLGTTDLTFVDIMNGYARTASPAFTGNPTAPTPTAGDNDTSLATSAFVANAVDGLVSVSVAGNTDKTLTTAQGGTGIIELTGALTGNINLNLPSGSGTYLLSNKTSGAYNITAQMTGGPGSSVILPQGSAIIVYSDGTNVKAASSAGQAYITVQNHTTAAGDTTLTVLGGYTPGALILVKNGAILRSDDFTATASPTVTLASAAVAGDEFVTYSFTPFQVADAVKKSGDTMLGPLTLVGNATDPLHPATKQQLDGNFRPTIGSLSVSVASNAMTGTLVAESLEFRSATLTDGAPVVRKAATSATLTVPNGATLGTVNGQPARIVWGWIDNAGTPEPFVVNLAGGANLDETTLISTTAISAAADSAGVFYSQTARVGVAFRVRGFCDITQASAGVWATDPALVQGAGGQALAALSSLGYSQKYQVVTGSRAIGTTYYNTTGRPIVVSVTCQNGSAGNTLYATIDGTLSVNGTTTPIAGDSSIYFVVPAGASYMVTQATAGTPITRWSEMR